MVAYKSIKQPSTLLKYGLKSPLHDCYLYNCSRRNDVRGNLQSSNLMVLFRTGGMTERN